MATLIRTMIAGLKDISVHFRFFSVFVLIASFLMLGSCPMKKAIQVLLNGSAQTEQTGTGNGKSLASVICVGGESSFSKKMTLPERPTEANAPLLTAVLITTFWAIWALFKSESQIFFLREPNLSLLHSVPLYLRNRTFLI